MESSFNIEILTIAFIPRIFTVTRPNHPIFELRFDFPKVPLEDIVDLLFRRDSVPEEEIGDLVIVFAHVILDPHIVGSVSFEAHSPCAFTILDVQILGNLGSRI